MARTKCSSRFLEAIEIGRKSGEQDFGISVLWIIDAVRHFGVDAAKRVVDDTIRLRKKHDTVIGIGIGGDEARGPAEQFRALYNKAKDNGLRLLAHAGESVGPESIWAALNIGANALVTGSTLSPILTWCRNWRSARCPSRSTSAATFALGAAGNC